MTRAGPQKDLAQAGPLRLDFRDLLRTCPLEELQIAIQEHPEDTIACMGFALGLIRPLLCPSGHAEDKVCVRLAGYEPMTPMREVKANMIGARSGRAPCRRAAAP